MEEKKYNKKGGGKGKTTVNREPGTLNRGCLSPLSPRKNEGEKGTKYGNKSN